jgi:hypothetical protein
MADNKVRNNSPDVTQYHEQVDGMPGTMIPRAGRAGESLGFNHDQPNRVVGDPGEDGGGFTLDLEALAGTRKQFNSAAIRSEVAADPTKFYRGLAEAQKAPIKPKDPKMNTEQPASPSAESARSSDPAYRAALSPLPPIGAPGIENRPKHMPTEDLTGKLQELLAEEKAAAQQQEADRERLFEQKMAVAEAGRVEPIYYDGGHYPPPDNTMSPAVPARERDTSVSDSYVLQQLMAGMTQQRETINALVALQTEKSAVEDIAVEEAVKEPEANPYPQHGIPFLEGDKPQRPQYETYFEMPKMGTMSARYHAVVEGNDCLALIYDTRFEDGFQYLPPSLGEERVTVSVPKLNNSVFSCSSLGLHWSVGCMDVVILIKHSDLDKNTGGE